MNGCLLLVPLALSRQGSVSELSDARCLLFSVVLLLQVCGVCFLVLEQRQWWWHVLLGLVFLCLYGGIGVWSIWGVSPTGGAVRSHNRKVASLPPMPVP